MNLKKRIFSCIIVLIFLAIVCLIGFIDRNSAETMGDSIQIGNKKIALTFDDGPHPFYTRQLLKGLQERNIKVTFFITGKNVETYPDIVKEIHEDGD